MPGAGLICASNILFIKGCNFYSMFLRIFQRGSFSDNASLVHVVINDWTDPRIVFGKNRSGLGQLPRSHHRNFRYWPDTETRFFAIHKASKFRVWPEAAKRISDLASFFCNRNSPQYVAPNSSRKVVGAHWRRRPVRNNETKQKIVLAFFAAGD